MIITCPICCHDFLERPHTLGCPACGSFRVGSSYYNWSPTLHKAIPIFRGLPARLANGLGYRLPPLVKDTRKVDARD